MKSRLNTLVKSSITVAALLGMESLSFAQQNELARDLSGIAIMRYDVAAGRPRYERIHLCRDGRALLDYSRYGVDFTEDTTELFESDFGGSWEAFGNFRGGTLTVTYNSGMVWEFDVEYASSAFKFDGFVRLTVETGC